MNIEEITKVTAISFFISVLCVAIVIVNIFLLQFNLEFGMKICFLLSVPPDFSISIMSPGFLVDIVIVMWVIESILLIPYYNLTGYLNRILYNKLFSF